MSGSTIVVTDPWWVTPAATLIATVLGGMLPLVTAVILFERQGERDRYRVLAGKAEELMLLFSEGRKKFTNDYFATRSSMTREEVAVYFVNAQNAVQDQHTKAVTAFSEAIDPELRNMLSALTGDLVRIQSKMAELQALADKKMTHQPIEDVEFNELSDSIYDLYDKTQVDANEILLRIAELRYEAERSVWSRLRDVVHRA